MINLKRWALTAWVLSLSTFAHAGYVSTPIVESNTMSEVGFTLTGEDISLYENTFTFPGSGHYCAKKTYDVEYTAGDQISIDMNDAEIQANGLSLNIMAWGEGQYKGFGGSTGVAELTADLPFDATRLSVGFCRYNNSSYEPFDITSFSAYRLTEATSERTTIVESTDMSDIGFTLTGTDVSLVGNTFEFPADGHYCAKKAYDVEYSAGDKILVEIDALEAETNKLALNIMAWGPGNYKGFGGAAGSGELMAELPFDATKISVGFCRYHNTMFEPFDISYFGAFREVPAEVADIPPVYPSCREFSQDADAAELIVDDNEPRTLQQLFDDGTIQPGMVVKLRRAEGPLSVTHSQFTNSDSPWLTIVGEEGSSIESVNVSSVKNIRFTGLTIINGTASYLMSTFNTENIIFDKNYLSGGTDHETWDAEQWQSVGYGVFFNRSKCSSAYDNELENLRFGMSTYTYDAAMSQEVQSQKALMKDNYIKNISADIFRAIGTDITIDGNTGLDMYVSGDDGDPNHDDFVQGFAYPLGTEFDNVKIINNFFQASTDPTRPYQSDSQGIVIFDGLYTNFEISNNTVLTNHWHGITVFWGRDGLIKNNTTIVTDDTSGRYLWIQSATDKSGEHPPENVSVVDNVSNYLSLHANTAANSSNNVVINRTEVASELVEYNTVDQVFDVSVKTDSVYFVEGTGSEITTVEESLE